MTLTVRPEAAAALRPGLAVRAGRALVGRSFSRTFEELSAAQWLPAAELRARSERRLVRLMRHAAENVPFYRDRCRALGIRPDDLRGFADLARLPVLDKAAYRACPPEVFNAANVPAYRRMEKATSGSTGEPFRFAVDLAAVPVIIASHLFYDSWFGLRPFERYLRIVAPAAPAPGIPGDTPAMFRLRNAFTGWLQRKYESWTQEKISIWEVDEGRAEEIWRRIETFHPEFVLGYTSTLATVADLLLRRGLRLGRAPRGVIVIAETLTEPRRRLIEEYFRAPIINRYGLREFGSWSGQSCPVSPERFHINTELVVCEILKPDGAPAAPGETGRVALTDLRNFARPFLRYDTGDMAPMSDEPCPCGRGFPLLGQIEGRSQECLELPSGRIISPSILGHYLFVYHQHLDFVRHYQLVYEAPGRVCLLVVPTAAWTEDRAASLREDLVKLVGDDVAVSVRAVVSIPPEPSGKRPIIKRARC